MRIVAAARELFAARGFAGTTVALIAERAGVAQPTVYAVFGNKGEIMRALLGRIETDANAEKWYALVDSERDPERKLGYYAGWHRALYSTGREVLEASLKAGGDPAVVEMRAEGDRSAYEWLTPIVATLAEAGALAPGLTQHEAKQRAWMLVGPELYFRATGSCGWSDDQYQQWLTEVLQAQLLQTPKTTRRTRRSRTEPDNHEDHSHA